MSRLVDVDKLISSLGSLVESGMTGNKTKAVLKLTIQIADAQPTVDAVPVVRCKDCRWLENDGYHTRCRITGLSVEAEDYCNRGERRKDGKTD